MVTTARVDPLPAGKGSRSRPPEQQKFRLAGDFLVARRPAVSQTCRKTTRDVAVRRVPEMCPECVRVFNEQATTKCRFAGSLLKPSDGLEPSTASLPWNDSGNRSQPTATVLACLGRFSGRAVCQRLPRVATAGLHKGSTFSCLCWLRRPQLDDQRRLERSLRRRWRLNERALE
jgi:hypothetical protein